MMHTILSLLLSFILLLSLNFGYVQPANAVIRQQEEAPEQMLYQSRHTLQDQRGNSWQVILFKRVKAQQVKQIDLRLVGFPDGTEFLHPQPLIVLAGEKTWQGTDQFAAKAPAPNVGEYDLKDILNQLPTNQSIELALPLKDKASVSILIPPAVVLEWQLITEN